MVKILIPSHHTNNKGDEAAMNGMIKSLKDSVRNAEFTILADYPEIASQIYKEKHVRVLGWAVRRNEWYPISVPLESFPKFIQIIIEITFILKATFNMFLGLLWTSISSKGLDLPLIQKEKKRILKEFIDADIVLLSPGGPYLGDGTSATPGLWAPVYLYHIILAQMLRKPIMIYAPSVGPFKRTKWIYKKILNGVQVITVREPASMKLLKELDLRKPLTYLTADCALLQQPANKVRVEKIMRSLEIPRDHPLLVGITIGWEYQPNANYKKTLASVADYLIKKYNAIIIFIPHVYGIVSDLPLINEIIGLMSDSDRVRILPEDCRVEESQGVSAELDLLIATRLHSFILAAAVGTPGIVIAYEHKAIGFTEMLGVSEFVVRIDALNSDEFNEKIDRLLKNSKQVKFQMASKIASLKKLAAFNAKLATQLLQRNIKHACELA